MSISIKGTQVTICANNNNIIYHRNRTFWLFKRRYVLLRYIIKGNVDVNGCFLGVLLKEKEVIINKQQTLGVTNRVFILFYFLKVCTLSKIQNSTYDNNFSLSKKLLTPKYLRYSFLAQIYCLTTYLLVGKQGSLSLSVQYSPKMPSRKVTSILSFISMQTLHANSFVPSTKWRVNTPSLNVHQVDKTRTNISSRNTSALRSVLAVNCFLVLSHSRNWHPHYFL